MRHGAVQDAPVEEGEEKKRTGVCGATIDTVVARNFARKVAAGAAAHSDHAREVAETFLKAAKGEAQGFAIKDEVKLMEVALDFGIPTEGRDPKEIAMEVGEKALAEFGRQHGEAVYIKKAPLKRQEIWRKHGVVPRGIDREVVEVMHRTHMGVDQDYKHLMLQATRCALADGWSGSMISTDLQDIMFGTPVPVLGAFNLGVLKEDQVNVVVHGHEPLLPELLVAASRDPEIKQMAEKAGAKGINLAGMCCSANEVLMRHGIPCAGNFLQQELALVTGAVEVMTVDVQCEMQGLADVAECFHTKLITTSDRAKIEGRRAHRVPPRDRPRYGKEDPEDGHRELPEQAPQRRHPPVLAGRGGRLLPRDDQLPPGRPLPGELQAAQRQHHQRPHQGRGRRGGLQQREDHPRPGPPRDDQGAAQERRDRPLHGLRGHGLRQGGVPHP